MWEPCLLGNAKCIYHNTFKYEPVILNVEIVCLIIVKVENAMVWF